MELNISTSPTPERYTIRVSGEVDISNADKLREAIDFSLEQPTEEICLDLTDVAYIDSTGIGVLVGAAHHAADHGKGFSAINAQAGVMRVAQLLGVDQEIAISAQ
ncbi:STAS domain-containing protein [Collinsella sp. An307]|uniref:STAS domain-containing protein n=1 Tax=Collinsella sp. An307 TaxID=1965630 RepID=UPI000B3A3EEA|nr:STAS domain-containing protein [Collinsella sp. An307]OUO19288.1 anti-anti-sigma factor [Collinsella sp. An307]